ncbi:hypothetical protein H310_13258 [Aphanomyces invadans]|uniref:Uncharacterized protein n=1 Tax=Aphanomyces invadans TaxID=157072 RepID=A0A024TE87_9STRA|nr:hypothetical protein H310_13258 [Aphanomyces invadans]ETV92358.1 hypothetical protein H310_13258 [Aphanomyces invadans]|eukprot:XP_008878909.1 hypothetical protein H310_13258 [Aphanomyces invadans]
MQVAAPPTSQEKAIAPHVEGSATAALVCACRRVREPEQLETWKNLERYVDEYQHRPLSERLRDRQRLVVQRMAYSSTARKLFGKPKPPSDPLLEQFKMSHTNIVDELHAMLHHAKHVAAALTRIGHVWSTLVQADASAMVEQSHPRFIAAGSRIAALSMTCGSDVLAVVVQPLEDKLNKLKQLQVLLHVEEDMRLLVLAATRKLERAQATASQSVFQRQSELNKANAHASRVATDLKSILDWVDCMRISLVQVEMDALSRLVVKHTAAASAILSSAGEGSVGLLESAVSSLD